MFSGHKNTTDKRLAHIASSGSSQIPCIDLGDASRSLCEFARLCCVSSL